MTASPWVIRGCRGCGAAMRVRKTSAHCYCPDCKGAPTVMTPEEVAEWERTGGPQWGSPCDHGVAVSKCPECRRARDRRYYAQNREARRAYHRDYQRIRRAARA